MEKRWGDGMIGYLVVIALLVLMQFIWAWYYAIARNEKMDRMIELLERIDDRISEWMQSI